MTNGRGTEQHVAERFERAGCETWRPPKAKYRAQDIFGLYDLVAFGSGSLYLVQVKGGRDAAGIENWMRAACEHDKHLDDVQPAFVHVTDTGCRLAVPRRDGYAWVVDERPETDSGLRRVEDWIQG